MWLCVGNGHRVIWLGRLELPFVGGLVGRARGLLWIATMAVLCRIRPSIICDEEGERKRKLRHIDGIGTWRCLAVRAWRMAAPLQPWRSTAPGWFLAVAATATHPIPAAILYTHQQLHHRHQSQHTRDSSSLIITLYLSPFYRDVRCAPFLLLTRLCRGGFRHPFPWEHRRPGLPGIVGLSQP